MPPPKQHDNDAVSGMNENAGAATDVLKPSQDEGSIEVLDASPQGSPMAQKED